MLKSIVNLYLITCLSLLLTAHVTTGQTIVKGKVTNAASGDPIPFAAVYFTGTQIGTTTDFEGEYHLQTFAKVDSLTVSTMGFIGKAKILTFNIPQTIDFQLTEEVLNLQELVFYAGENPAYDILRNVIKNKNNNNKHKLDAYQYESYNKIEIDIDNLSDEMRTRKIMQKVTSVLDSVEQLSGEDGKPILPVFVSESLSEFYFRRSPQLQHEKILKTKISGVGVEDGTLVAQLIGSTFQNYNFYENWLDIVEKDFVSPIADGWKLYYEYDLSDSGFVDDHYCYKLDFFPKREQDLAFYGTMWITKQEFALKQIDAAILPVANLNYIEKIKIQQELIHTEAGQWLPLKSRILIDIGEVQDGAAGMLLKFIPPIEVLWSISPLKKSFIKYQSR